MFYYVRSAAHQFMLEWNCRTGNEDAVREHTRAALSAKVTPHQLELLMKEFDRDLSRFGYEVDATPVEREKARIAIGAQCDPNLLADLKAQDAKRLSYIDHPEGMSGE